MCKAYGKKYIQFLKTENTIEVTSTSEFDLLMRIYKKLGLCIAHMEEGVQLFKSQLARHQCICIEYNNDIGTSLYSDRDESILWYGDEPLSVYDVAAELDI